MNGRTWIAGLIAAPPPLAAPRPVPEPTWSDLLNQVRAENPGRGQASAYLAAALGVSRDQARRYLAGTQAPSRSRVRAALAGEYQAARDRAEQRQLRAYRAAEAARQARHRRDVADFLRLINAVNPGRVRVRNISGPTQESSRAIGRVEVDLGRVADLWEAGRFQAAEDALSTAIIDAYGEGSRTGQLSAYIEITDYPQGMTYE